MPGVVTLFFYEGATGLGFEAYLSWPSLCVVLGEGHCKLLQIGVKKDIQNMFYILRKTVTYSGVVTLR